MGDQRCDDDEAAIAKAQLVMDSCVGCRADRFLAEVLAHALSEPRSDRLGRDLELACLDLQSPFVPSIGRHCISLVLGIHCTWEAHTASIGRKYTIENIVYLLEKSIHFLADHVKPDSRGRDRKSGRG